MGGRRADAGTREQWRKLIAEAARSGMSTRAFCRGRGVSEPLFYSWRARLNGPRQGAARRRARTRFEAASFALVSDAPGALDSGVELVLADGRRLRIRQGVDEATLRTVLAAVGSASC